MIHKYTFRKQIGARGLYASIIFDVSVDYGKENSLEFDFQADAIWKTACEAGVLIFFDYFKRMKQGRLMITVTEIKWNPVDTNQLIIIFATLKGLCEALDLNLEHLNLDEFSETFRFPECRTLLTKTKNPLDFTPRGFLLSNINQYYFTETISIITVLL